MCLNCKLITVDGIFCYLVEQILQSTVNCRKRDGIYDSGSAIIAALVALMSMCRRRCNVSNVMAGLVVICERSKTR